jgi:hypothetical protein
MHSLAMLINNHHFKKNLIQLKNSFHPSEGFSPLCLLISQIALFMKTIDTIKEKNKANKGFIIACIILSVLSISCGTKKTISTQNNSADCPEDVSVFHIKLNTEGCDVALEFTREFTMTTDIENDTRTIISNNIPNHNVGVFPNPGNPNIISPQSKKYVLDLAPTKAKNSTPGHGLTMGILMSGAEIEPYSGEFFIGSEGDLNRGWNYNVLNTAIDLGTDCNNAHVQPTGNYHYHGTPNAYLESLNVDGSEMVKIGYAADGFPIYYKYGYDERGDLKAYKSGYVLKSGDRGGDGVKIPQGCYDGRYFQDYEYKSSLSDLDECNGKFGKTPESESEYYYIITDNFPSAPLCLSGTPSDDFKKAGGGPLVGPADGSRRSRPRTQGNRAGEIEPGKRQRPDPASLIKSMDKNGDGMISGQEAVGPLRIDFSKVDLNKDGFISLEELKKAPSPNKR